MEFDKSKILTVVTADQAKVGQKGWFASNVETLSRLVLEEQPKELLGFDINNAVHAFKTAFQNHALFYPAPEPAYYPFKVGDEVIVDTYDFDVATVIDPCDKEDFMIVDIKNIRTGVKKHSCKLITYRSFANAEEFKPFREKWIKSKQSNACSRVSDYSDFGVQIFNSSFKYRELMNNYEFEDTGDPCGIRNIV